MVGGKPQRFEGKGMSSVFGVVYVSGEEGGGGGGGGGGV